MWHHPNANVERWHRFFAATANNRAWELAEAAAADVDRDELLDAAHAMKADGWWLTAAEHPGREKSMRAGLMREVLGSLVRVPRPLQSFYTEIMRRKKDEHFGKICQFFDTKERRCTIYEARPGT